MPSLLLIAGPNGAGKSTSSKKILEPFEIIAFDYDHEFYSRWKKFSYDPLVEQGVRDSVSQLFLDLTNSALKDKTNFAFETNFHHSSVMDLVENFSKAGFTTHLIFIALPNEQAAIDRVADRVAKGGHDVDAPTILERFAKGLKQLDSYFDKFDMVHLHLSERFGAQRINWAQPKLKEMEIFNPIPDSLRPNLTRYEKFIQSIQKDRGL